MLCEDENAVWVIQSWQGNPKSELLAGIGEIDEKRSHALVLDLYGEKTPHYKDGCPENESYGYREEFDHTPWVLCTINNFGGRLGMSGFLDYVANEVPKVLKNCKYNYELGILA